MKRSSLALATSSVALLASCGSGRDIHGGLRAYRITDAAQVFAPVDLRADRFTAYVARDGRFESLSGLGYADGVFIIVDVPDGDYLLRHDSVGVPTFYASASDDIDLTSASLGRTDLLIPASPSALRLNVGALSPWSDDDRLQIVAPNLGFIFDPTASTATRTPSAGDVRLDGLTIDFAAQSLPLVDETRGDRVALTQLEAETFEGGRRLVLTRYFEAPPFSVADGAVATSSGSFAVVPRSTRSRWTSTAPPSPRTGPRCIRARFR